MPDAPETASDRARVRVSRARPPVDPRRGGGRDSSRGCPPSCAGVPPAPASTPTATPRARPLSGAYRLERRDESVQALRVETPGAAPNQLERHRVDARQARELVGSDPPEPPKERRR